MSALQPRKLHYFDYVHIAREAEIAEGDLRAMEHGTRGEYGSDDMLFELRMLRNCAAIRDHRVTVKDVLAELTSGGAQAA